MKWWILCWLVLSVVSHHITCKNHGQNPDLVQDNYHCSDEDRSQRSDRSDEDRSQSSDRSDEDRSQSSDRSEKDRSQPSKHSDEDRSQRSDSSDEDRSQRSDSSDEDRSQRSDRSGEDRSQPSKHSADRSQRSDRSGEDRSQPSKHSADRSQRSDRSDEDRSQRSKRRPRSGQGQQPCPQNKCQMQLDKGQSPRPPDAKCFMEEINSILKNGNRHESFEAIHKLERFLEETEVTETTTLPVDHLLALLHRPKGPFKGVEIYASENEVKPDGAVMNSKVSVRLPRELGVGSKDTIVFCMIDLPEQNVTGLEAAEVLYESRLVGLSVRGKNISGLQEHVNITMNITMGINVTQEPRCVFFNFSTQNYSSDGCLTTKNQSHITCSCDHLTYFGVLMVSANLSPEDQKIQSYITLIGCSISLFALVLTLLLFITKKKVRADVSMKVHINLAIALILLNVHFLPSHAVAAHSSPGLCLYMALALHYSLLAAFCWMALEGFHLYLLLVKVFNIYIRRYLLKLSVLGWGIPAVIVSLVVIIDRDAYGLTPVNSNSTAMQENSGDKFANICYITNDTVKMVTTVGVFVLVFAFNVIMLGVMVRRVLSLRQRQEFEQNRDRAKREIFTLLGITILLGIPWGVIFFSFGKLNTVGLYIFAILNSLQGFFIFLWFLLSLRKTGRSAQPAKTSTETRSTNG